VPKILDGGLATELEARGHDLADDLWSARLLLDQPAEILAVHHAFIQAGADIITTASYQATISGFCRQGLQPDQAEMLLRRSVRLAMQARQQSGKAVRVAASVGPYGAFLANGAEYTGDYDRDEAGLYEFHRQRWQILASEQPDIMLCETIPGLAETRALERLAREFPEPRVWISFSCRSGSRISDGTGIEQVVDLLNSNPAITGVGANCTDPRFVPELVRRLRQRTTKLVVIYPNSGEVYDPVTKSWSGPDDVADFARQAVEWRKLGADVIGGCCRVTPRHIRELREQWPAV
jgi:homocysteine S-methyltransferase